MAKLNKVFFSWGVVGYLLAVLVLGVFMVPVGIGVAGAVITWGGITLLPFLFSYHVVSKCMVPLVKKAQDEVSAAYRGIGAAILVAATVSGSLGLIYSVATLFEGTAGFSFGDIVLRLVGGTLLFVIVGLGWTLIPSVLVGGAMGCCMFRKISANP